MKKSTYAVIVEGTRYIVRAMSKARAIARAEMEEDKKRGTIGVYNTVVYTIAKV